MVLMVRILLCLYLSERQELILYCLAFFLLWLISDDEGVYHDDQLEFDTGFGNIIVVDNLPVVPKAKFEKLENVLKKIYNQLGVIKENGLWMPVDPDTGVTLGYCFIEFNTPQVTHLKSFVLSLCHMYVVDSSLY